MSAIRKKKARATYVLSARDSNTMQKEHASIA